jgi:hypothetical protein
MSRNLQLVTKQKIVLRKKKQQEILTVVEVWFLGGLLEL